MHQFKIVLFFLLLTIAYSVKCNGQVIHTSNNATVLKPQENKVTLLGDYIRGINGELEVGTNFLLLLARRTYLEMLNISSSYNIPVDYIQFLPNYYLKYQVLQGNTWSTALQIRHVISLDQQTSINGYYFSTSLLYSLDLQPSLKLNLGLTQLLHGQKQDTIKHFLSIRPSAGFEYKFSDKLYGTFATSFPVYTQLTAANENFRLNTHLFLFSKASMANLLNREAVAAPKSTASYLTFVYLTGAAHCELGAKINHNFDPQQDRVLFDFGPYLEFSWRFM